MLEITPTLSLKLSEVKFSFIRAPGPGGQNVNKLATAVLLRLNVIHATIPEKVRQRLIVLSGKKLTLHGDLIIKASHFRTQERNKQDALQRLQQILKRAATPPRKRKKTKPTFSSIERRLTAKKQLAKTKSLRRGNLDQG